MAFTGSITFSGKEALEGILQPAFITPRADDTFTVVPIKDKQQVVYMGLKEKITKIDAGCGDTSTDASITATEKYWDPVRVEVYERICATDWDATLMVWSMKNGLDYNDLTDTQIAAYVLETYPPALRRDFIRMAWLGDTAAATAATTGIMRIAGDIPYYSMLDGLWKKLVAAVGATAADVRQVTITENAAANFAAQLALATDKARDTYRDMLTGATNSRLKAAPDAMLLTTQSLYENWLNTKELVTVSESFKRQSESIITDTYRGKPLIPVSMWDDYIQGDTLDNGTLDEYHLPHRAVFTSKANLMVGVDTSSVEDLEVWYDRDTKYWKIRGGYKMDTQFAHKFMTVLGY